ncbi:MAG: hypothetical protein H0T91_02990 [Propionibacteriaceae bacterium]|nr:hypothetical protein [Propionibacteriaceae bacterium]
MFALVIAGTIVLMLGLRAIHTGAQDGLPTPEGRLGGAISIATQPSAPPVHTPTPLARPQNIPGASECTIDPRTIDGIIALDLAPTATPRPMSDATPGATAPPVATPTVSNVTMTPTPADRPATAAMVGQIQRTVREMTACGNSGDLLKVWAFFTDDYITTLASEQGAIFNRTILSARVTSQQSRSDAMPTISNVRVLGDGRLSALVTVPLGSPFSVITGEAGVVTCVFEESNGRYRIDQVTPGDGTGGP